MSLIEVVGAAHGLGRLQGELGVVLRVLVAELPGPVDLVAQAPDLDVPGLVAAVLAPLLRPVGVAGSRCVYSTQLRASSTRAQPGVDAHVGLDPELLGIAQELVRAEAVALDHVPGLVAADRPLVARADAILPVVAGGEVAARPAQERHAEPLRGLHDVLAEAVRIRERAAFLEDAAVDAAAEVLGEVAEHVRVDLADHAVGIDLDARGGGGGTGAGWAPSGESGEHGEDGGAQAQQPAMSFHRFNSFS